MRRRAFQAGLLALAAGGAGCSASRPGAGGSGAGSLTGGVVGAILAAGTPGSELPPDPGPTLPLRVPVLQEERWPDNGLHLIVAPRNGLPLVSVSLLVRCGSAVDPAGRSGCAVVMGQLLAKGAWRRGQPVDGTGLARQAEALGGTIETTVTDGAITLSMTVTSPLAGEALALLGDVLRQPLLAGADLQQVRAQLRDALGQRLQDPALLATAVVRRTAWGRSVHGTVTTPESLSRIRRDDVAAMHRQWVRPDRVAVVLAGDIDLDRGRALVTAGLGRWPLPAETEAEPRLDLPSSPPQPVLPQTLLINMPSAAQTSVALCAPFAALDDSDLTAGLLACAVLGGGHSARINQEVRTRRGLSYSAVSRIEQQRAGGLMITETQTSHAHAAEVALLMRDQALALSRLAPGAGEMAARRSALLGTFARQLDTTDGIVRLVGEYWAQGRALADLARYPQQIQSVEGYRVRAFARNHWAPDALRLVLVGRLDEGRIGLETLDPQAAWLDSTRLVLGSPLLSA